MSIENRLKEDARNYNDIQPPADLRARLSSALDQTPARRKQRWKRWLAPAAVAALLLLTIIPLSQGGLGNDFSALLNGQPIETDNITNQGEAVDQEAFPGVVLTGPGLRTTGSGYISETSLEETLTDIKKQFEEITILESGDGIEVFRAQTNGESYKITVEKREGKVYVTID